LAAASIEVDERRAVELGHQEVRLIVSVDVSAHGRRAFRVAGTAWEAARNIGLPLGECAVTSS